MNKRGIAIMRYSILMLILFLVLPIFCFANDYFLIENYFEQNGTKIHQIMLNVTGSSMSPNLNNGDLIIIENSSRTNVITWEEGERKGYRSFNLPGDVILYRPYGKELVSLQDGAKEILGIPLQPEKATPIISRALRWVDKGQNMCEGGPPAPFSGYITKGDHNDRIDQMAGSIIGLANTTYIQQHQDQIIEVDPGNIYLDKKTGLIIYKMENKTLVGEGISYLTPVKKDWIIGIVRAQIPYGSDWTKSICSNKKIPDFSSILGGIKW
jgi:signal peptidase